MSPKEFEKLSQDEGFESCDGLLEDHREIFRHHNQGQPRWLMVHILLIVCYSLIFGFLTYIKTQGCGSGTDVIFSPARGVLIPKKIMFQDDIAALNPFRGPPRPELDNAWHELVKNSNIRITADELRRINRTSVQLSDGSGEYMAELNVYHQLHCLKVLRQALDPEYYDLPPQHKSEHLDHCLDNLRQLVMCKADVSLQTYDWLDNNPRPFANFVIEHDCYNFDAIDDWAEQRAFDIMDGTTLVHPFLGPSFPVDDQGQLNIVPTGDPSKDPLNGNIITPPLR